MASNSLARAGAPESVKYGRDDALPNPNCWPYEEYGFVIMDDRPAPEDSDGDLSERKPDNAERAGVTSSPTAPPATAGYAAPAQSASIRDLKIMYLRHVRKTPRRSERLNHVLNVIRFGVMADVSTGELMRDLQAHGVAASSDRALDADLRATVAGMRMQKWREARHV